MKKVVIIFISVIVVSAVLFGIAMGVKKYREDNALMTADSAIDVSNDIGVFTVTESVAIQLLSQYPDEVLGLSKPIYDYIMKLSETNVNGKDACKIELYLTEDSEVPSAIFAIAGYECFVYNVQTNDYFLLTKNGAFEVEEQTTNVETTLFYDEKNDKALHDLVDKYDKETLGFAKQPSEYVMVTTGVSVKAVDGKKVYIIKMYEKDGTETNYTCAFRKSVVYKYDAVQKQYSKIKK